ncbi:MAG: DegT/DnrJ/EryC1/StrS family aminotransferase [Hyphomicrobiaceae bacterium]|nr:DegT/DnrJ/EryC1/StrS family aminotransferase [Hyphomicrobiaceae bacterium]
MAADTSTAPPPEKVPFNDLSLQWRAIEAGVKADFEDVFKTSAFCLGPHAVKFEAEIATWAGARHAIGVNSGTSALHLAMLANDIGPGDEVLIPAQTFIATAWGVIYANATPVLCDVDEATATIDLADAERRITTRTKAIMPVHLYGQPADMAAVRAFADKHGLIVVEDAAQSIGARYGDAMTGTIGACGCVSFYPGKNLGAAGEAGLVFTNDDAIADRLRSLRNHGQRERYVSTEIGYNYRLDGLQAVVLRHKLKLMDGWIAERKRLAGLYQEALAGLPIAVPRIVNGDHVWHLFVIRSEKREAIRQHLTARGIETGLHYPVPVHRQPCMASYGYDVAAYPVADRWSNEGLSLPLFVGMSEAQVACVASAIREALGHG